MPVFLTNQYVTIRRLKANGSYIVATPDPMGVFIYPLLGDAFAKEYAVDFEWGLHFPLEARYPDGSEIQQGDEMLWKNLVNGKATLHYPAKYFQQLAVGKCFFKDVE